MGPFSAQDPVRAHVHEALGEDILGKMVYIKAQDGKGVNGRKKKPSVGKELQPHRGWQEVTRF